MISREDLVTQSVTDYVREAIFVDRGYPADQVELLESFPYRFNDGQFLKNYIALGFDFDTPGEQAEMGSDLMTRTYTIEFWIFGQTNTYARNLANQVKFALERDGRIPLKDISQAGAPVIDYLIVLGASAEREAVPQPEPWQEFVWTTTGRVEDTYYAALV